MSFIKIRMVLFLFSIILCLSFLTCVFSETVYADSAKLQIIGEPTYYCYKAESDPAKYYYLINVTFYNSGSGASVPINIQIYENEEPTISPDEYQGISILPREYKNCTFNWITPFTKKTIEIRYKPSSSKDPETEDNSGIKTIEVDYYRNKGNKESTPGFEFLLLFIVIAFFISFEKCKKRI